MLEPAQRAHFSNTVHAKLDHALQASSAKILGPASHFQDLVSHANPLSSFQVDGSNFFYMRKFPLPWLPSKYSPSIRQVCPTLQSPLPLPLSSLCLRLPPSPWMNPFLWVSAATATRRGQLHLILFRMAQFQLETFLSFNFSKPWKIYMLILISQTIQRRGSLKTSSHFLTNPILMT